MVFRAEDKATFAFWDEMGIILISVCFAINLYFFILLTETKLNKLHTFLIFLPIALIIGIEFTPYRIVTDYIKEDKGWEIIYSNTYYFYMFYAVSYLIVNIILAYRWSNRTSLNKNKLQIKAMLFISIPVFLICVVTDFILPNFDFYKLPALGGFGLIIYAFAIWYSFVKYRFLIPKSSLILNEIIHNIQESVLLLNIDLKIIMNNDKFKELLELGNEDCRERYLFDYASENNEIMLMIEKFKNNEIHNHKCRLNFNSKSRNVVTNSNFTAIIDKFNDLTGVLLVLEENEDIKKFQKTYNLSDRQMEIIDLCLSGSSNSEISDKLSISKRTTEAHIRNIYNKLGINNKIELYNLCNNYNISSENLEMKE